MLDFVSAGQENDITAPFTSRKVVWKSYSDSEFLKSPGRQGKTTRPAGNIPSNTHSNALISFLLWIRLVFSSWWGLKSETSSLVMYQRNCNSREGMG